MPNYSYICEDCNHRFEIFSTIRNYKETTTCTRCQGKNTCRNYISDVLSQSASVKKSDTELKTLGDLALRNSDRMSEDQKRDLHTKHNAYKDDTSETKQLPSGMSRIKKSPKIKWR